MIQIIVIFLFGLAVGSFLNVVVLRGEREESLGGRSRCMACGAQLRWYELLPVLSYLLQLGRCRTCRAHISLQYPLVELATALTFIAVYVTNPVACISSPSSCLLSIVYCLLSFVAWSLLIAITVYDLRTTLIPDRLSYSFAVVACFLGVVSPLLAALPLEYSSLTNGIALTTAPSVSSSIVYSLWSMVPYFLPGPLLFLPFYFLWKVSDGRWIGLGDGKLALGIGWMLGLLGGGSAVMFAFWIGAAVSLTLVALQRLIRRIHSAPFSIVHSLWSVVSYRLFSLFSSRFSPSAPLSLRSEIPFGPFLVFGTAIVYFTGFTLGTLVGW